MKNIPLINEEDLLRYALIEKIRLEWNKSSKEKWHTERWFKNYTGKYGTGLPKHITRLPNGFFESFVVEVNETVSQYTGLKGSTLAKYTLSASSIERFLGKHGDKHSLSSKKKTGLAIYVGQKENCFLFQSWNDFKYKHQLYLEFCQSWENNRLVPERMLASGPQPVHFSSSSLPLTNSLLVNDAPIVHFFGHIHAQKETYEDYIEYSFPKPSMFARYYKKILFVGLFIGLLLSVVHFVVKPSLVDPVNYGHLKEQVNFQIVKIEPGENRASVWLAYDVKKLPFDSITVKPTSGDAVPHAYVLKKSSDTLSFIFLKPYGSVSLLVNDQPVANIVYDQPTNGWLGWVRSVDGYTSAYHTGCELIRDGVFSYWHDLVKDKYQDYYFIDLLNINDFGINGDECTLEARIRLVHKPFDATCTHIGLDMYGASFLDKEVLGEGIHTVIEMDGCEHFTGLTVGASKFGNRLNENYVDLSKFTKSFKQLSEWNTLRIHTHNQKVAYYWNDQLMLETPYTGKIGYIGKLSAGMKGSWGFDWIRIKDASGKIIYQDTFDTANCLE